MTQLTFLLEECGGPVKFLRDAESALRMVCDERVDLSDEYKKGSRGWSLQEEVILSANGLFSLACFALEEEGEGEAEVSEETRRLLMRVMNVFEEAVKVGTVMHYPRKTLERNACAFAQALYSRGIGVDGKFQRYLDTAPVRLTDEQA